jgi:hypothetical protein
MKRITLAVTLLLLTVSMNAQHLNVMISNANLPEEPCIIINPKNPQMVMAAANINNIFYSLDGGLTWEHDTLYSSMGVWGDPVVIFDTAGHVYFFHLSNPSTGSWIDRIICQKAIHPAGPWNDGTYMGLNGTKAQDKEWAVVDPATNYIHVSWTQFDKYGSADPLDSSMILYSRSTDQGLTWSNPQRINAKAGDCIDSDNTTEGAVPAIGPNGQVYVAWAGPEGLLFDRSLDGGQTWLANDIFVDSFPSGWDYSIPGIYRCNGLPVTKCDISNGPHRGTIYINWSDQRNGSTDTDVWLAKSTDGGNTWTGPIRVNDDPPGKQQFFTWMDVDPVTGYLYFVFYDRRNHSNSLTDVYMAVSKDGGNSFINFKISESPFLPNDNVFFGDYNCISAYNSMVRPIWTRLHNNQLSVWTAIIDQNFLGVDQKPIADPEDQGSLYPNPAGDFTYFAFKVRQPLDASLHLFDSSGRKIATLFENRHFDSGKYIESINLKPLALSAGVYMLMFDGQSQQISRRIVVQ